MHADRPKPTPPPNTLPDALDAGIEDFAELVRAGVRSPATLAMHQENAAFWKGSAGHLSHVQLADFDAEVLSSLSRQEAAGRRKGTDGARVPINPGTLRKRLSTLRLALEAARRRRWIPSVPEFPRVEFRYRPLRDHLRTVEELETLAMTLPLERAEWVYVAAFTGMHPADLNRMRAFVDVDPFGSPPWFLARNTKNRDPDGKPVELPAPAADVLRRRFDRLRLRPGDPALEEWKKDNRCTILARRARQLGIGRLRATTLRHTFGTWAVDEMGTISKALMEWLGHRSLAMLEQVYAHALAPRFREIAAAVARKATRIPRLPSHKVRRRGAGEKEAPAAAETATGASNPNPETRRATGIGGKGGEGC